MKESLDEEIENQLSVWVSGLATHTALLGLGLRGRKWFAVGPRWNWRKGLPRGVDVSIM